MDNEDTDQRLEHHRNPPQYLELADLYRKTGVEYFKVSGIIPTTSLTFVDLGAELILIVYSFTFLQINADEYQSDKILSELRAKRGYTYDDEARSMNSRQNSDCNDIYFADNLLGKVPAGLCQQAEGVFHGTPAHR